MPIRTCHVRRWTAMFGAAVTLAGPLAVEVQAQAPARAGGVRPFDTGIVIGGEWLQANALPLDRDAMQSASFALGLRRQSWAAEAGFLRIARSLSTVQGGYLSGGPLLEWKRVLFIPTLGAMVGESYASRDSTGYNFVATDGTIGHQARFSYSDGLAFGGSVGLTVEIPIYRMFAFRGSASEWFFGGDPLEGDRTRTVLGAGLSVRVGR